MDAERRVLDNAALAVVGDSIAFVGTTAEALAQFESARRIDGSRFVITPGLINGHIHVTGDPLTRAWLPDKTTTDFESDLTTNVLPRFHGHSPDDECVSAELAALKMLRSGTTTFIEAGTVNHLDRVAEGASRTGIRGRVGIWVEGTADVEGAIARLEREVQQFPAGGANASRRGQSWLGTAPTRIPSGRRRKLSPMPAASGLPLT